MRFTRSAIAFAAKRTRVTRFLSLSVFIGAVIAIALGSGVVMYVNALEDVAASRTLADFGDGALNTTIRGRLPVVSEPAHTDLTARVERAISSHLSGVTSEVAAGFRSDTLFIGDEPQDFDDRRAFFAVLPGVEARGRLVSGHWPRPDSNTFEGAIEAPVASEFQVGPGDLMIMRQAENASSPVVQVRISGVFERIDRSDPIWTVYEEGFGIAGSRFKFAPILVTEESFLSGLPGLLPDVEARYTWHLVVDRSSLNARSIRPLEGAFSKLDADLRGTVDGYQLVSELDEASGRFSRELTISEAPFFIIGGLLILATLYYTASASATHFDLRNSEMLMFRARGATRIQVSIAYGAEALIVSAVSITAGVVLAWAGVKLLGTVPWLSSVNDGLFLPARFSAGAWLAAVAVGIAGFAAATWPTMRWPRDIADRMRRRLSRPDNSSAFYRYYLDLVLLGAALLAIWRVSSDDSQLARDVLGSGFAGKLSLAMPAFLAAGLALGALRVLPIILRLAGALLAKPQVSQYVPIALTMAVWTLGRSPSRNFRIAVLLIIAITLGLLVASFTATATHAAKESARYDVGADIRVTGLSGRSISEVKRVRTALENSPGVTALTEATRLSGTAAARGDVRSLSILGVRPDMFPLIAWSRPGVPSASMEETVAALDHEDTGGVEIPAQAEWISARIRPTDRDLGTGVVVRLSDSSGRIHTLSLGDLSPRPAFSGRDRFSCEPAQENAAPDWCRIGASLGAVKSAAGDALPLRLQFMGVSRRPVEGLPPTLGASMLIDDISTHDRHGSTLLDSFDGLELRRTQGTGLGAFGGRLDPAVALDGSSMAGIARITWDAPSFRSLNGVRVGDGLPPLPVIASGWFRDAAGLEEGSDSEAFIGVIKTPVTIAGFTDFFPTLDPESGPFLIANIRDLWGIVAIDGIGSSMPISEIWVSGGPGTARRVRSAFAGQGFAAPGILDTREQINAAVLDPLTLAGWKVLLAFGFATVLGLTALGFLVQARANYSARRFEFAILRSEGLTEGQLGSLLLLEQLIIAGLAVAAGAIVGIIVTSAVLPLMIELGSTRPAPPIELKLDWNVLAAVIAATGLFIIVMTLATIRTARGASLSQELRRDGI